MTPSFAKRWSAWSHPRAGLFTIEFAPAAAIPLPLTDAGGGGELIPMPEVMGDDRSPPPEAPPIPLEPVLGVLPGVVPIVADLSVEDILQPEGRVEEVKEVVDVVVEVVIILAGQREKPDDSADLAVDVESARSTSPFVTSIWVASRRSGLISAGKKSRDTHHF